MTEYKHKKAATAEACGIALGRIKIIVDTLNGFIGEVMSTPKKGYPVSRVLEMIENIDWQSNEKVYAAYRFGMIDERIRATFRNAGVLNKFQSEDELPDFYPIPKPEEKAPLDR
uniref:Uncharacterized protein n=1 Tax=viral metagenome TaxID=1070528 RepID=A0A6H1ZZP2_9ZZZZ